MRFYWNADVFGWRMFGLVGKKSRWFVGVSIAPEKEYVK